MYAVYQINGPVFGTGETPQIALDDAWLWMGAGREIVVVPCTRELHNAVQESDGDIRCEFIGGVLEVTHTHT